MYFTGSFLSGPFINSNDSWEADEQHVVNTHSYVIGVNVGAQQVGAALGLQDHPGMRI